MSIRCSFQDDVFHRDGLTPRKRTNMSVLLDELVISYGRTCDLTQ